MIMTTVDHFDTILDSLRDAEENAFNAYDALPDDSDQREGALELAFDYEALADRWEARKPIGDDNSLALAIGALRASEDNCRELGLDSEADEYEAARLSLGDDE